MTRGWPVVRYVRRDGQDDYADAVRVRVRSDHGRQGEGLPRDTQQLVHVVKSHWWIN